MSKEQENIAEASTTGPSPDDRADAGAQGDGSNAEAVTEVTEDDLRSALASAESKAAEHLEAALRAKADFENLRKRSARDVENAHKFGVERFVSELLPVLDSLELGLAASTGEDATVVQIREGVELTLKMFQQALAKFEVAPVDPKDQSFNPEFHQAISMQTIEGVAAGTVVTVVQKGYLLHGRLVRPAMVIVAE